MNKIVRAQYYANDICNVVQLLAAFVASFIADVISFLAAARVACCMFYCSCNRGLRDKSRKRLEVDVFFRRHGTGKSVYF